MRIENSMPSDVPRIFELYRIATSYMKSKNQVAWPEFERELITKEIKEQRQWKLIIEDKIACIWATTLNDELIWGIQDHDPSIYIHRIATSPDFRGRKLVSNIILWANEFGKKHNLQYIRMDTVGVNEGLIKHYTGLGFDFLGTKYLPEKSELPAHYHNGKVCYFQKEIK